MKFSEYILNENVLNKDIIDIDKSDMVNNKAIKSIIKYMRDNKFNIDPLPKLKVIDDDEENAKKILGNTGNYDPDKNIITLFTKNRHEQDILRTLIHELIHHSQYLNGDLDVDNINTNDVNKSKKLEELEKDANYRGAMILRYWKDSIKFKDGK